MAEEHNEHQLPLEELMKILRPKLEELYKQGINPYGERFERTHLAREIIDHFDQLAETETRIAGRIMSFRTHGKASFADLADQSGRIQLYIRVDQVGEAKYEQFCKLDIGDVVAVYGRIFRTRRGEISVEVYDFLMMAKSLASARQVVWAEGRGNPLSAALPRFDRQS